MMDQSKARRVLAEVARRRIAADRVDLASLLFDRQLAFVTDTNRHVVACCSRRAGKSEAIAHKLVHVATGMSDILLPYVTLTKAQGKRILWPVLRRLNSRLKLDIKFNSNDLTATFPNQSQIFIIGGDDETEMERLRGPKYPLVVFDEAQAMGPFLQDVIEQIVEPAVMDYDGQILLTGTPNAACVGTFHDAANGLLPGWSVHSWTCLDNPHLPHVREWLANHRRKKGWSEDHPTYLREWCGRWVRDDGSLVYAIQPFNVIDELPDGVDDWQYVLGIDLGYVDSTAFVVMAFSETAARCVTVESYKESRLIPSAVAARVEALCQRYPFEQIVADAGGLGKGYVEEMRQRYGIPVRPAEKTQKSVYIELLNGDLRNGSLSILRSENAALLGEVTILQWDEDRKRPDPRYEDHLADAWLYAWRYCHAYLNTGEKEAPDPGSEAWWKAEADRMEEEDEKILARYQPDFDPDWDD